jgi:hypothetical protein
MLLPQWVNHPILIHNLARVYKASLLATGSADTGCVLHFSLDAHAYFKWS